MTILDRCGLFIVTMVFLVLAAGPAPAQTPGESIRFENSGSAQAQEPFLRGVELLHSFEYGAAASAFRQAQQADPDFAMAYWGEAMTYNHPVWMEQDTEKGRAVLRRLADDRQARLDKAATPREKAYLNAVEILYGEGSKEARDHAYSTAMAALHSAYPDDIEARVFYALSLLGLAHEGRDFALYMRAAALLEEIFPGHQRHPGVLHYLIHSYDDPIHAPLGLRAARLYGDVAPYAAHALHMTSHIFVAMGMWEDVVDANLRAMSVVNDQRAGTSRPPAHCGHYAEWLVYGYLQRGDFVLADRQITRCRSEAEAQRDAGTYQAALENRRSAVSSHAQMALWRLIHTGGWLNEAPLQLPEGQYLWARLNTAYGAVLANKDDASGLKKANGELNALITAIREKRAAGPQVEQFTDKQLDVVRMQAAGLLAMARGDNEAGIATLRRAAQLEASLPLQYGPPVIAKPSFELLGDMLLKSGRHDQARAAYEKTLSAAPNRYLAQQGLARIAAQ